MKRFLITTSAIALCLVAGTASAAISGSAHDFSNETPDWGGGEICKACHAPHNNGVTGDATEVLWNHDKSVATYTTYDSPTFEEGSTSTTIGGSSKLCLSCHDGTVALDSYGGAGTPASGPIDGDANFGTDLSNDHPISFAYDATGEDLAATSTSVTFSDATPVGATIGTHMLDGGNVECKSCHDVHNKQSANAPSLLLIDNAGSALCQTCHTK